MTGNKKTNLKSIGQKSIVEQIINSLTESIIRGEYKSGTKLPSEFELMEEMQVSRNSLREAMKILSAMGIVEIRRGDGTYICSQANPTLFDKVIYSMIYDVSSSEELLELRQVLDEATVQMAAGKITSEEIAKLQKNINDMQEACNRSDVAAMQQCDMEFHKNLIDSCKNVFFVRIMKGVYTIFENSISENLKMEQLDSKAAEYHQRILDCVTNKKYESIHQVVKDSLITWRERV